MPDFPRHRGHSFWKMQLRTVEWSQRQSVSLLELSGLSGKSKGSRRRLQALARCGIQTADAIANAPLEELVRQLSAHPEISAGGENLRERVKTWKHEITRLMSERNASKSPSEPTNS